MSGCISGESTGLGLSIVQKLVSLHGGKVWAESAGQHRGSTFIIELPALATHPTEAARERMYTQ